MKPIKTAILVLISSLVLTWSAEAVRIKDIAEIGGVRANKLVVYGLVIGLNGTGDKRQTQFTVQSLVSMLERMGDPGGPLEGQGGERSRRYGDGRSTCIWQTGNTD